MMLSIDEAIAYEREVAKEHKDKAEYQINRGIESPQIDLHIQAETEQAEEHKQLAEWLEELKALRTWKNDVMEDFCKVDCGSVDEVYQCGQRRGYNKAINDFTESLREKRDKRNMKVGCDDLELRKIAKQLKEG